MTKPNIDVSSVQKTVTSSVSFQEALGDEKPENERPETNFNASHAE